MSTCMSSYKGLLSWDRWTTLHKLQEYQPYTIQRPHPLLVGPHIWPQFALLLSETYQFPVNVSTITLLYGDLYIDAECTQNKTEAQYAGSRYWLYMGYSACMWANETSPYLALLAVSAGKMPCYYVTCINMISTNSCCINPQHHASMYTLWSILDACN